MKSISLEGIVIKRHNFGEADKILTIFSKQHGKISVIAKGVRKTTSRRAGSLELFNLIKCQVVQGKNNMTILTEVQLLDPFSSWRSHLGRVNIAYQLSEVLDKLLPEYEPHLEVYEQATSYLKDIGRLTDDWKMVTKHWFVTILSELGYWPVGENFDGDIYEFIEEIISRPLHSPKLLNRLK